MGFSMATFTALSCGFFWLRGDLKVLKTRVDGIDKKLDGIDESIKDLRGLLLKTLARDSVKTS